ncbi:MAG: hypothetical protein ACI4I9_07915 [Porcipelethomonas sp.]
MADESTIFFLHNGFVICTVLAVICTALAVVLFFMFDIKVNYAIRTGKLKQKKVEEMKRINAQTGSLRNVPANFNFTGEMEKSGNMKSAEIKYNPPVVKGISNDTSLLEQNSSSTIQLDADRIAGTRAETSVLNEPFSSPDRLMNTDNSAYAGDKFSIIECVMLIHTDEVI